MGRQGGKQHEHETYQGRGRINRPIKMARKSDDNEESRRIDPNKLVDPGKKQKNTSGMKGMLTRVNGSLRELENCNLSALWTPLFHRIPPP